MTEPAASDLLVPNLLPDGTVIVEERGWAKRVVEALRAYDPRLNFTRNLHEGAWEMWRRNEDGSQARVGRLVTDREPSPEELVLAIASHDTRRGYDPFQATIDRDNAIEAAKRQEWRDEAEALADKLHWGISKDFSLPGVRPIAMGGDRDAS